MHARGVAARVVVARHNAEFDRIRAHHKNDWDRRCGGAAANRKMFKPQANRPFRQSLLLSTIVIGFTTFGAVILYAVTEWLWLVVHQGLRTKSAFKCFKS
jgi:multisubunit Na+/H+ antiporter MnhC subunit